VNVPSGSANVSLDSVRLANTSTRWPEARACRDASSSAEEAALGALGAAAAPGRLETSDAWDAANCVRAGFALRAGAEAAATRTPTAPIRRATTVSVANVAMRLRIRTGFPSLLSRTLWTPVMVARTMSRSHPHNGQFARRPQNDLQPPAYVPPRAPPGEVPVRWLRSVSSAMGLN
jgi:hypothetical protein